MVNVRSIYGGVPGSSSGTGDLSLSLWFSDKSSNIGIYFQTAKSEEVLILTLSMPGFQKLAQARGRNPPPS